MKFSLPLLAAVAEAAVIGGRADIPPPGDDGRYTISSDGIKAQFIPYGASLTNLFVKDKNGDDIDVVLGYDDAAYYPVDPGHPVYNSIPGRYANRIGNGTYTLNGETIHTEQNDGNNTLHSGTNNWSYRVWEVTDLQDDAITFAILDKSNSSLGFFGDVQASVTYSVKGSKWNIKFTAESLDQDTPLLLTHHTYFNLDAFRNPDQPLIWDHKLSLPYSQRYLEADQNALPTGQILTAEPNSINDFASSPDLTLGHARDLPGFEGNCGADGACEGYNGYFLIEDAPEDAVVATLASEFSGVKAELRTDQPGIVLYSCNWMDGTADLKSTQGIEGVNEKVVRSSCVAIEAQDYPDGINHPEWERLDAQIYGPGRTYNWETSWTFSLLE
ncbi:galactose mutarotase-like domain-containing protein [Chaetomium sp. MPI-SDFR-AT-0129]|uniref:Galactose mutarotase-like domain-containing protein n=1 Tax=Dichotomopilus funicola TaxID=1934379 RepID=A0AAN6V033_9PEZI|nr:galactose mutarotase-like domain-containing protein [Chaetomium sp. MPI-SDFR-AT-0129]KAK4141941.1 galactose mutarotase-like domain-containing protein [Dichotomopilus funicola]